MPKLRNKRTGETVELKRKTTQLKKKPKQSVKKKAPAKKPAKSRYV